MRGAAARIPNAPGWIVSGIRASRADRTKHFMGSTHRRAAGIVLVCSILVCFAALLARSSATPTQEKAASAKKSGASSGIADAYRFNALGVAYMNQQRPADAQKHFEQALESDAKFAVARLNLGVSLLAQQKLEAARVALEEAAPQLPKDAYAWYNLGLVYKDLGETEKGVAAFQRVTEIAPNEADAYYFTGNQYSQLHTLVEDH